MLLLQVFHSQRLNDTPLKCWMIIEENGEVCCAHCNCMAGLGEVCTHVAAVLFYIETLSRLEGVRSCTDGQCAWALPSLLKSARYLPIKDIDFTSARGKKRKLDELVDGCEGTKEVHKSREGMRSTSDELTQLFSALSITGPKVAVLSVVPEYSDVYVPKTTLSTFPQPIASLYKLEYVSLGYQCLLDVCKDVTLTVTHEMAEQVELQTRQQANSKLWFKYRAGRVTASNMKAVCHTDSTKPSKSLIKRICYPELFVFTSKQTDWGRKHEKLAREEYIKAVSKDHQNLQVLENGLVINPRWPYIGASPDGIVECDCCDKRVLEVKCPYNHREDSIEEAVASDGQFCLVKQGDSFQLDQRHAYYYQVQTQIFVCDVQYCDFCLLTFGSSDMEPSLYVERITRNNSFWDDCVVRSERFFVTCLLPEVIGHWYTRETVTSSDDLEKHSTSFQAAAETTELSASHDHSNEDEHFCICNGPDEGTMICCDNNECAIKWFHLKCLKMSDKSIPKGKWYCSDCQKISKTKGKGKSRKIQQ